MCVKFFLSFYSPIFFFIFNLIRLFLCLLFYALLESFWMYKMTIYRVHQELTHFYLELNCNYEENSNISVLNYLLYCRSASYDKCIRFIQRSAFHYSATFCFFSYLIQQIASDTFGGYEFYSSTFCTRVVVFLEIIVARMLHRTASHRGKEAHQNVF